MSPRETPRLGFGPASVGAGLVADVKIEALGGENVALDGLLELLALCLRFVPVSVSVLVLALEKVEVNGVTDVDTIKSPNDSVGAIERIPRALNS